MTSRQNKSFGNRLKKLLYVQQPAKPKPKIIMTNSIINSSSLISLPPDYKSQECLFVNTDEKKQQHHEINDLIKKLPQRIPSSFATKEEYQSYESDYEIMKKDIKQLIRRIERFKNLYS